MDRNKEIEVKDLVSHVSGMYKGMEVIEIFNNGNTVKCSSGGCQLVFPISSVVLEKKHSEDESRRVKRIYLSGPISGRDLDERRKAFSLVKERLKSKGYEVVYRTRIMLWRVRLRISSPSWGCAAFKRATVSSSLTSISPDTTIYALWGLRAPSRETNLRGVFQGFKS